MLIACPDCATTYDLAAEVLGEGRDVRCTRCATTWFATPVLTATAVSAGDTPPPPNWPSGLRFIDPDAGVNLPATRDELQSPATLDAGDAAWSAGADADVIEGSEITTVPTDAPDRDGGGAASQDSRNADIESAAARQATLLRQASGRKRKKSRLPLVLAACVGVLAAALFLRNDVVRVAPQAARLYAAIGLPVNLRGVDIAEVKISGETHEGVPVLVIEGKVVSKTKQTVEIPKLRFAMRGSGGTEIYAWTMQAETRVLGAGETLPFRTRLASPPGEARDVMVRFQHRRDF